MSLVIAQQYSQIGFFGVGGSSLTVGTLPLDSAFSAGSSGDVAGWYFVPLATGTLTDLWINIASYSGAWGSTDGVVNVRICPATSTSLLPDFSNPVTNGTFTITLDGSTTGWVKHTLGGTPPTLTAGVPYWIVIGDGDGGATNFVTLNVSAREGYFGGGCVHTGGFSAAGTTFGSGAAGLWGARVGGLMHGGAIFESQTTTASNTLMRGNRLLFDAPQYLVAVGVYTDASVAGWEIRVYESTQAPSATPYATRAALNPNTAGQTLGATRMIEPVLLNAGVAYYVVVYKTSSSSTPRYATCGAGLDADLKTLFPLGGEMYSVAQHATNDEWVLDDTLAYRFYYGLVSAEAGGGGVLIGSNLIGGV